MMNSMNFIDFTFSFFKNLPLIIIIIMIMIYYYDFLELFSFNFPALLNHRVYISSEELSFLNPQSW